VLVILDRMHWKCTPSHHVLESHFGWLAQHPLDTARDAWRAESGASICQQDMAPVLQLAVLQPGLDVVHTLELKWSYVLHVRQGAVKRTAEG
jgi:kynureninase